MNVDVVVPIYNAYKQVKKCLKSLQKHSGNGTKIILIDDASTDKRINPYIKNMAQKNAWKIYKHKQNHGFVKTANQALKLTNNHTILLNSDTIVTKCWVKAFKQALKKNPNLGTATPWSNNAEICSLPHFLSNQSPPKKINKLAKCLYDKYQPQYPIIPTAVGFCMLISAKAKQQVGYFDEAHFGHGYGEENDYSLRVTQAGLLNILCDNAYVVHIGNQSFSELGMQPSEKTMQRLLQKHPSYSKIIQEYIANDPLLPIRTEILSLLSQEGINI